MAQSGRRLAAIMFTDMVGYSALSQRNERLALELVDGHGREVRRMLPRWGGRVVNTTGDGFVIEFGSALQALYCAIALQQQQAARNALAPEERRFEFRIGIHLGEVEPRGSNIIGDGVNLAARIEPLSPRGGVALSANVQALVANKIEAPLRSLGTPDLKNIAQKLEVFALDPEPLRAIALPEGDAQPERTGLRDPRVLAVAAAVLLFAIGAIAGFWQQSRTPAPAGGPAAVAEHSVAVLPFANLSAEADSAFFTDGLHDTLLTHLSRIDGLKVISRTSVLRYREGERVLPEIARALGVAYIVEGSVQRAGERLRVTAQLIRAADDVHVWANDYERSVADVFAVQADLAQRIASAVQVQVTPDAKARIERPPTANLEAYSLHLRALEVQRSAYPTQEERLAAVRQAQQAVALDPNFAAAWATLALLHDDLYWSYVDASPERLALLREAAENAARLDPELAEARVARAVYLYHGLWDLPGALAELDAAAQLAPGSSDVHAWRGYIARRQGRGDQAVGSLARSIELDPLNESVLVGYVSVTGWYRRYDETLRALGRLESITEDRLHARYWTAQTLLSRSGDLAPLEAFAQTSGDDPQCLVRDARYAVLYYRRQFAEAARALENCLRSDSPPDPIEMRINAAESHRQAGNNARARALYQEAVQMLEESFGQRSEDFLRARMAFALMRLGQADRARQEIERSQTLMPLSRDATDGELILEYAVAVRAGLGDTDGAIEIFRELVGLDYGIDLHNLALNPAYDELRKDPRFETLLQQGLQRIAAANAALPSGG